MFQATQDFSIKKRARNIIRFGKRAEESVNDYNNDYDYDGDMKHKRSAPRRKMSNFIRFGRR